MAQPTVIHDTFVIERNYNATPARVFAAFSDPAQKRRWFVESAGHQVSAYDMDFREGGRERARFTFKPGTPVAGLECINDTSYQVVVPGRYLLFVNTMNIGGRTISASQVTVEVLPVGNGSQLILTHQGAFFEGADGPEMRKAGWQGLMDRLTAELASHAQQEA